MPALGQEKRDEKYNCHICGNLSVVLIDEFSNLYMVTSDRRPWKKGGRLGLCQACNNVQKIIDSDFLQNCKDIYGNYSVYYPGQERRVFEQSEGVSLARSEKILAEVFKRYEFGPSGRLLDIGCGNGNLLRSFSKLKPTWTLAGLEIDNKHKNDIEKIDNVTAFYSCDIEEIREQFDVISMIHVLEHIVNPLPFLKRVRSKLKTDGLLLVEVPQFTDNPFDLVIADHCSHFEMIGMKNLLRKAGFEIIMTSSSIVPKEMTVLAGRNGGGKEIKLKTGDCLWQSVCKAVTWLQATRQRAVDLLEKGDLGIFGTSIAGCWLFNEIAGRISFFVDEDRTCVNNTFLDRIVYHPDNLPAGKEVYIPLPFKIAKQILERIGNEKVRFHLPPEF